MIKNMGNKNDEISINEDYDKIKIFVHESLLGSEFINSLDMVDARIVFYLIRTYSESLQQRIKTLESELREEQKLNNDNINFSMQKILSLESEIEKYMLIESKCNHSWFRTTKKYKPAWKCSNCGKVSLTKKNRNDKDNKETIIFPFTQEAVIKLRGLIFFDTPEKISIALPNEGFPYLIIDHTEF